MTPLYTSILYCKTGKYIDIQNIIFTSKQRLGVFDRTASVLTWNLKSMF